MAQVDGAGSFCVLWGHVQHEQIFASPDDHVDGVSGPHRIVDLLGGVHFGSVDLHHNIACFHASSEDTKDL